MRIVCSSGSLKNLSIKGIDQFRVFSLLVRGRCECSFNWYLRGLKWVQVVSKCKTFLVSTVQKRHVVVGRVFMWLLNSLKLLCPVRSSTRYSSHNGPILEFVCCISGPLKGRNFVNVCISRPPTSSV